METVSEAAKRAGIKLEWVETGLSSSDSFRKGLVDLWPLMVDLPDRRKFVHFARPWMHTSDVLLLRIGSPTPGRRFRGHIAVFKMPLHVALVRAKNFRSGDCGVAGGQDIIKKVCKGADAGFIEARTALIVLREKPRECDQMALRVQTLPGTTLTPD